MKTVNNQDKGPRPWRILGISVLVLVVLFSIFLAVRVRKGNTGLRSLPRTIWNTAQAVLNREDVTRYSRGEYKNIVFLHHSTGDNLIEQGHLHQMFSQAGYSFWDQGYNSNGLRDPDGRFTGFGYSVPGDNTDPDGLAIVFDQPVYDWPINTFSALLQHEVIVFKSCFAPTSKIASDDQLELYKDYYLQIRNTVDDHPDRLFILVTQPPLNPAETNPEEARRARMLADWLASDDYLGERMNYKVFDLFDLLAEGDQNSEDYNMLRESYRNGNDSHPNREANIKIAPQFVDFVIQSIQAYRVNNLTFTP